MAELEFRERVRGIACRRGWLSVALRRRVVVFEVGERIVRHGEWDTCDNPKGALSLPTQNRVLTQTRRPCSNLYRSVFNPPRYSGSSNGTCPAHPLTAVSTTNTKGPSSVRSTPETPDSAYEASGIHHRSPHDFVNHPHVATVWQITSHDLFSRHSRPYMGCSLRKARQRA